MLDLRIEPIEEERARHPHAQSRYAGAARLSNPTPSSTRSWCPFNRLDRVVAPDEDPVAMGCSQRNTQRERERLSRARRTGVRRSHAIDNNSGRVPVGNVSGEPVWRDSL